MWAGEQINEKNHNGCHMNRIIKKIAHSELFWTTLVGKYWKSCNMAKIGHSESIWTSVGKYWKSCKTAKIGHSESIQITSVGKYQKSCKMA